MKKIIFTATIGVLILMVWICASFFTKKQGQAMIIEDESYLENSILMESKPEMKLIEGWTSNIVNVWSEPSTDSANIGEIPFNQNINYVFYNDDWLCIEDSIYGCAFIENEEISNKKIESNKVKMPSNSGFKSYMSYDSITDKSSPQYKMQSNFSYTGKYGIRMAEARYCVAVGTGIGASVGTYIDLHLNNGAKIECIVGDIKSDNHTLANNIMTEHNGCVVEFIVDLSYLHDKAKIRGDISYCNADWKSPTKTIEVYEKNIWD